MHPSSFPYKFEQITYNSLRKTQLTASAAIMFKKAAFQIAAQRTENIVWFSDEVSLWDTFSL